MNDVPWTAEDFKRMGETLAAAGSAADELAAAVRAFVVAFREAYDALGLPDEAHGMTLDELLGDEGAALIRANKIDKSLTADIPHG